MIVMSVWVIVTPVPVCLLLVARQLREGASLVMLKLVTLKGSLLIRIPAVIVLVVGVVVAPAVIGVFMLLVFLRNGSADQGDWDGKSCSQN
jgi:hypothetical protein